MVRPEASSFGSRRQSGVALALERIPDIGGVSKTLDLRRIRRRPGERFAGARPEAEARSAPLRAVPRHATPRHAETLKVSLRGNVNTRMPEHH